MAYRQWSPWKKKLQWTLDKKAKVLFKKMHLEMSFATCGSFLFGSNMARPNIGFGDVLRSVLALYWWSLRLPGQQLLVLYQGHGEILAVATQRVLRMSQSHQRRGVSNHRQCDCLSNRLFRSVTNKRSKFYIIGLFLWGKPLVTHGWIPRWCWMDFHGISSSCFISTNLPLDKMAAILADDIFRHIFMKETFCVKCTEVCSQGANLHQPSVGLDNGLAPNRRQAIIWTNADPIYWRIYAALWRD